MTRYHADHGTRAVALIGNGPSRKAFWFSRHVSILLINRLDDAPGYGQDYTVTIPEHLDEFRRCGGFVTVLCDVDNNRSPVKGHTAPRILRYLAEDPTIRRIYLQGFDLDRPEYESQIAEFGRVAAGAKGRTSHIIVTTPGPLGEFFTVRRPDSNDIEED